MKCGQNCETESNCDVARKSWHSSRWWNNRRGARNWAQILITDIGIQKKVDMISNNYNTLFFIEKCHIFTGARFTITLTPFFLFQIAKMSCLYKLDMNRGFFYVESLWFARLLMLCGNGHLEFTKSRPL